MGWDIFFQKKISVHHNIQDLPKQHRVANTSLKMTIFICLLLVGIVVLCLPSKYPIFVPSRIIQERKFPLEFCEKYQFKGVHELEQLRKYQELQHNGLLKNLSLPATYKRTYQLSLPYRPECIFTSDIEITVDFSKKQKRITTSVNMGNTSKCVIEAKISSCYFELGLKVLNANKDKISAHGGDGIEAKFWHKGFVWNCFVQDYFNGSYGIKCPHFGMENQREPNCSTLALQLQFVNYFAYSTSKIKDWINAFNSKIFSVTICFSQIMFTGDLIGRDNTNTTIKNQNGWYYNGSGWLWLENGHHWHLTDSEIKTCFRQMLKSLTIIGDSHMRYNTDYISHKTYQSVIHGLRRNWHMKNIQFMWLDYADNIPKIFQNLTNSQRTRYKTDVIVMSIGAWDARKNGVTYFIERSIPLIIDFYTKLQQNSHWHNARKIWYSITACPETLEKSRNRNNFAIAAANAYMETKLKNLGVEIFDAFTMTYLRSRDRVCGGHYLCIKGRKPYGEVGINVINSLIKMICEK